MNRPSPRALSQAQEKAIATIAAMAPGVGRQAAFLRCVLGERSWFEIAYIAERWHADA